MFPRAEWNHALAAQRCLYWILARGSSASFRSPAPRLWSTAALRNVPSRVEVGRLPPSREFEHPPLPSVINPKISASVNHRVSPSFRPRLGARSLIARRVTLKRSATLISACLGRMTAVWQTLDGTTNEKSKAVRSRKSSGDAFFTRLNGDTQIQKPRWGRASPWS
jgi:hypothetical protein